MSARSSSHRTTRADPSRQQFRCFSLDDLHFDLDVRFDLLALDDNFIVTTLVESQQAQLPQSM